MQETSPTSRPAMEPGATVPSVIDRNRGLLAEARREVYKKTGNHELELYLFFPPEPPTAPVPAMLFFYSSSWDAGLISQFAPHALHFAQRGLVSILVDYRVSSRHATSPQSAMADARSAIRWTRQNAANLRVDPTKIICVGASGGAHIACSAALLEGFDEPTDNPSVSCIPEALILFSPFLDCTQPGCGLDKFPDKKSAKMASPIFKVSREQPPILILHGTSDRVAPVSVSKKFVSKSRWRGNKKCRLSAYEGQGHGFFNFNVDVAQFERTINEADGFLVELGLLPEDADINDARLT